MNFYIVSYDIPNDKRRLLVAKTLENFASRIQYSVFEANLEEKDFLLLQKRLKEIVDLAEDNVRFYRLCQNCLEKAEVWGETKIIIDPDYYLV